MKNRQPQTLYHTSVTPGAGVIYAGVTLTSLVGSLIFTPDNISFGRCAKESGHFNFRSAGPSNSLYKRNQEWTIQTELTPILMLVSRHH
jgi:hypothetical protein